MKIESSKELGNMIRRRRKQAGLTIDQLAVMAMCSPRLLGEVERGTRNVGFEIVLSICALLGIELYANGREESR